MYNMKIVAIALFFFSTCFLQEVISTSQNPVINGDTTVKIPVSEVIPSSTTNGNSVTSESSSVAPVVSPSVTSSTDNSKDSNAQPEVAQDITVSSTEPSPITKSSIGPTLPPNVTTIAPSTPTPTPTPKPTSTKPTDPTSTPKPPPPAPSTSTVAPPTSTLKPTAVPPTTPTPSHRRFDGPSFIGGIVLALGLVAIGFVAFKFYKARTELNYHTL